MYNLEHCVEALIYQNEEELGMVVHSFDPSLTPEASTDSETLRLAWSTYQANSTPANL